MKVPTLCLDSSKVEHAAVNRGVVGSSPTRGAENRDRIMVLSQIVLQWKAANGSVVKRLRHRPFTAVTWVQFPSESLLWTFSSVG